MSKNHVLALVLASAALPACTTTDNASSIESQPLATLTASHLAGELGVTTWQIHAEGDGWRVIGLDDTGERQAELVARPDASTTERVHVESVFPEHGTFELTRDGIVGAAPSASLGRLARAANADLGKRAVPIDPSTGGTIESAITLQNEGSFQVGLSWFPHWNNIPVGVQCPGQTRAFASAQSRYGAATCTPNGWLEPALNDCRVNIQYSIGGFSTDVCRWSVYVN